MNQKQEIVLGFTKEINESNQNKEEFPSFIGGQPVWLCNNNIPQDIKCKLCDKQMTFLLQIFSPLDFERAYYRAIYVFICTTSSCSNKESQMRIFRTQCKQQNDLQKQQKLGEESNVLKPQYSIITDYESFQEAESYRLLAEEKLNSFNVADDKLQSHKYEKNANYDKELELAKKYTEQLVKEKQEEQSQSKSSQKSSSQQQQIQEDSDDDDQDEKDRAFVLYQTFINQLGEHSIRFCRDVKSQPLWFSDKKQWKSNEIKNCQHCGKKSIFEFQINSCLLNLYSELMMQDWGIAAIYTCQNSCDVNGQLYVEEQVKLQIGVEDPLTAEEIEQKLAEMKLEAENMDDEELKEKINGDQDQPQNEIEKNNEEQQQSNKQKKKKNKNKNKGIQEQSKQEEESKQNAEEEEDDW